MVYSLCSVMVCPSFFSFSAPMTGICPSSSRSTPPGNPLTGTVTAMPAPRRLSWSSRPRALSSPRAARRGIRLRDSALVVSPRPHRLKISELAVPWPRN